MDRPRPRSFVRSPVRARAPIVAPVRRLSRARPSSNRVDRRDSPARATRRELPRPRPSSSSSSSMQSARSVRAVGEVLRRARRNTLFMGVCHIQYTGRVRKISCFVSDRPLSTAVDRRAPGPRRRSSGPIDRSRPATEYRVHGRVLRVAAPTRRFRGRARARGGASRALDRCAREADDATRDASSRDAVRLRLIEARGAGPSRVSRARFERGPSVRARRVGGRRNERNRTTRIERRRRTCARAGERTRVRLCERNQRTTLVEFRSEA